MQKYIVVFYYSCLIVIGNDMSPQTGTELSFCICVIFLGAFLEAYIIGGITAEFIKSETKDIIETQEFEYVKFSIENHLFPPHFSKEIT